MSKIPNPDQEKLKRLEVELRALREELKDPGGYQEYPDQSVAETEAELKKQQQLNLENFRLVKYSGLIVERNRRLGGLIRQLGHDLDSLVSSRRWKIGDGISRLFRMDFRGSIEPGALSHARRILEDFEAEQDSSRRRQRKNIPGEVKPVEELMRQLETCVRALSESSRFRAGCLLLRISGMLRFRRVEPDPSLDQILKILDEYKAFKSRDGGLKPAQVQEWIGRIGSHYRAFLQSSQWRVGNSLFHAVRTMLFLNHARMATDQIEVLLQDYTCGVYAPGNKGDEPGAGSVMPRPEKRPAGRKTAVVMHAFYRQLLPELFEMLGNLEEDYDLFVTIPEEVESDIEPVIRRLAPDCFRRVFRQATEDVTPFLKVIQEIHSMGYEYVCKIHTKRDHPDIGPIWRECLLDGVLGSKSLTGRILEEFRSNDLLQSAGSALMYMPVTGHMHDGRERLEELRDSVLSSTSGPEEWGFFGGTMFWARVSGLSELAKNILTEGAEKETGKTGNMIGHAELLERMLGIVPFLENGQVGLVDYVSTSDGVERILTCSDFPDPLLLPLRYRLRAFELVQKGLFKKYHLLMESGLLDSCYYLAGKPEILDGSMDCLEDYLNSGETGFLSREHEEGKIKLRFQGDCLAIERDGREETVRLAAGNVAALAGWRPLPDKNNQPDPEILVSVICMTYNHEQFIRQALDGFLSQKTDFRFEVIIGDDCSRDRTPGIVQEYADRFPRLFVFIRRPENIGTRANATDLRRRIRGKYVIQSEGDDYWIDPLKLQVQVDHMEAHPECSVCFHPVLVKDECNPEDNYVFPAVPRDITGYRLCLEDILERNLFQTCSVMYRWQLHGAEDEYYDDRLFPGDWYNHILHARFGEIHQIERIMAVYRRHQGGMWSSFSHGLALFQRWGIHHIQFFRAANKKLSDRYHVVLIRKARGIFVELARFYYDGLNIEGLYELIDSNRDIAQLSFHRLNWPLDLGNIYSPQDLAREFKRTITVSTVITSFNNEAHIEECLESVVSQRGLFTHEVIIADDFSDDGTPEIIRHYAETFPEIIRVLPTQGNIGMRRNMEKALEACQGDFIAICEGDDYWISAEKIHKQLSFLLKNPELPMCFNRLLLLKEKTSRSVPHPGQEKIKGKRVKWEHLLEENLIANFSCCFYRREAVRSVSEAFFKAASGADWFFNLLVCQDSETGFVREFLSVYRITESGLWSGTSAAVKEDRIGQMYEQFLDYFPGKKHLVRKYAGSTQLEGLEGRRLESPGVISDPRIRFQLDINERPGNLLEFEGWFRHPDHQSFPGEEKILFIVDCRFNIYHTQVLENRDRAGASGCLDPELPQAGKWCDWSGFSGAVKLLVPDGDYLVALGLFSEGALFYQVTDKQVISEGSILAIRSGSAVL